MSRAIPVVEFDRVDSNDFHLLIVLNPPGFRCGYVGVPPDHFAYGSPKDDFNVHGGITFRSYSCHNLSQLLQSHCYWGFDCGHYGDANDFEAARNYGISIANIIGSTVRTFDYVRDEIFSLAHQLNSIELFI